MPKQEQIIVTPNMHNDTALAYASLTMQELNWPVLLAGENSLVGTTKSSWKNKPQQIICVAVDGQLTIISEMVNGEMADITGKNKKNCNRFAATFETVVANKTAAELAITKEAINNLRQTTLHRLAEEEQEAIEVDKAMNLSGSNTFITYGIIAINVIIFVLMALDGAGIMDANGYVHLKWGSNYGPLTLSGDWWRLITNTFIHFGIIHLAMNMYCLYTVGIYLEPMLGKIRYATAYLCTAVLASVISLYWHTEPANSAGASGAVFGVYGVFLALLTSNLIPKKVRTALLQNIVIFVGYNLLYGLKGGIDNAAHIGGLLSGLVIGYAYMFAITKEKAEQPPLQWLVPVIVILSVGISAYYLQENKKPISGRKAILSEMNAGTYKDNDRFNAKLTEFDKIQANIDLAIGDSNLNFEQLAIAIDQTALPQYEQAASLIRSTSGYDISPAAHAKASLLLKYIDLKKQEMGLMKQICITKKTEELMPQLNAIRDTANNTFQELLKL